MLTKGTNGRRGFVGVEVALFGSLHSSSSLIQSPGAKISLNQKTTFWASDEKRRKKSFHPNPSLNVSWWDRKTVKPGFVSQQSRKKKPQFWRRKKARNEAEEKKLFYNPRREETKPGTRLRKYFQHSQVSEEMEKFPPLEGLISAT